MNSLARVVHNLVTGKAASLDTDPALSLQEQAALANLATLLRLSPRELVVRLEQAAAPLEWASSTISTPEQIGA